MVIDLVQRAPQLEIYTGRAITVLAVEGMRQAYQKSASYLAIPKRKKGGVVASTRVGNHSMTLVSVPMPEHCPPMHEIAIFANGQNDAIAVYSDGRRAFSCHNHAVLFAEKMVSFTAHILSRWCSCTAFFASKQLTFDPAAAP
jgi:hypothetical protein